MRVLMLGRGKTGSLVAEVARERGHAVTLLGRADNPNGAALQASLLGGFDVVIDFTTPDAVLANLHACLRAGARVVVGTTGWHQHLPELTPLAPAHGGALLYGTNFSVGVQALFRAARVLAASLPGYAFSIHETHHVAKKDAPSGTALTLQRVVAGELAAGVEVPITSNREGDVAGLHVLEARSGDDRIALEHDAFSRRGFAEGAVRAAEWLLGQAPGVWEFSEVSERLG